MMNKSLRAREPKSSRNRFYGFQTMRWRKEDAEKAHAKKKSRRFRRLLKLITGRRQTEWTGATRCPTKDKPSHKRESLIDRKQAVFFRIRLPCRPLAECQTQSISRQPNIVADATVWSNRAAIDLLRAAPSRTSDIDRASSSRL
jgi:hypothetical protein